MSGKTRGNGQGRIMRCLVAMAALVVSGGIAVAETPETFAPSTQQGTPHAIAPETQPRLDAEGYNMDKPAPPGTMGPVKRNPDPSAASAPDVGDAANPTATMRDQSGK
jgi:hypothetical protein